MDDMFLVPDEISEARAGAGLEPEASALPRLGLLLPFVGWIIRVVEVQGARGSLRTA